MRNKQNCRIMTMVLRGVAVLGLALLANGVARASTCWGEDTDGDGQDDHIYFDRDDDGNPDELWVDDPEGGALFPDEEYQDTDDDGDWDRIRKDDDGDGDIDGWRPLGTLDDNPRPLRQDAAAAVGDTNGDGSVNNFDIDSFVLAMLNRDLYESQVPGGNWYSADINGDGRVNNFDIDPFVGCIVTGNCP